MKLSLLALCALCAAPAWAQTEVPADALPPAPKSAATADALVWRVQPEVGARYTMRLFSRFSSEVPAPSFPKATTQMMKVTFVQRLTADYDILSRDALGATTIRLTYRTMKATVISTVDGKAIASPAGEMTHNIPIDGATLTVKQAPDGAVWNVVGFRAFMRRILQANGITEPAQLKQSLDALDKVGGERMLKSVSLSAGTLPASPVRVGESWNYTVESPFQWQTPVQVSGQRTLKKLDADFAYVADNATLDTLRPVTPGDGKIKEDYSQLKGTISATSRIERSSGLPLESLGSVVMSGVVTSTLRNADGTPRTLTSPINVTVSTRVVLEPR